MTDISATPSSPDDTAPTEAELTRRLHDLATITTGDIDGTWEQIQARLATTRRHPSVNRRLVLAVAAVVALVVGAAVVARDDDGTRVHTDDTTSTTDDAGPPTTRRRPTSTTSTTAPGPRSEGGPAGSEGGGASGQGGGAMGPGGPDEAAGGSADAVDPGGTAPTVPPAAPSGGRLPAAVTQRVQGGDYEVLIYWEGTLYFRRTDDYGAEPGPPDGYGYLDAVTWGDPSGTRCLAAAGGDYSLAGTTETFLYGLAGWEVEEIVVTTSGGTWAGSVMRNHGLNYAGEDGLAEWLLYVSRAEVSLGDITRVEGRDANGNVVVTLAGPANGGSGSSQC